MCFAGDRSQPDRGRAAFRLLYATESEQDDDNYKQQTEPAARIIPPTATISPCRQRADQKKNQNNDKDRA